MLHPGILLDLTTIDPNLNGELAKRYPVLSAIFSIGEALWIPTYILLIRLGVRQKTYAMPMLAICLAFTMNFIFSFVCYQNDLGICPHSPAEPWPFVLAIWLWRVCLVFSGVLVWQYVRYGRTPPLEHPALVRYFWPTLVSAMILAGVSQYGFMVFNLDFNVNQLYLFFTVAMGLLFLLSLFARGLVGHGLLAGISRFVADSLMAIGIGGIAYLAPPGDPVTLYPGHEGRSRLLIYFLCAAIILIDGLYVVMVMRYRRAARATST